MTKRTFDVMFDHFQLMIGDKQLAPLADTSEMWKDRPHAAVVEGASEVVGIATVRYGGKVRVQVVVDEMAPLSELEWAEVGHFEVFVPSGEVILFGPEADDLDQHRMSLPAAGRYDGVLYSTGTESVVDEMSLEGDEQYLIHLSIRAPQVSSDDLEFATRHTWCSNCRKADLGMDNVELHVENGRACARGNCTVCGEACVSELSETMQGS